MFYFKWQISNKNEFRIMLHKKIAEAAFMLRQYDNRLEWHLTLDLWEKTQHRLEIN